MLQVETLSCTRGDKKLFAGLSFSLEAGGLLFVHGPNGSGKTTLLRTLCGLSVPADGAIKWDGENIQELAEDYRTQVSYMGHLNGLKDELTGLENLQISATLAGVSTDERAIGAVLKRLGVAHCQELPTKYLSQGQKKRVALARFIINKTKLWILDEAFVALDVHAVDVLQTVIAEHVTQGGMAILTTHQAVDVPAQRIQHLHLNS